MEELEQGIGGREHRRDGQSVDDGLRFVLAVKFADQCQKNEDIEEIPDQFQPRHIFNIGGEIASQGIGRKGHHGPRQRRPKQFGFMAGPDAQRARAPPTPMTNT